MLEILRKVYKVLVNVVRVAIKTLVVALLILNMVMLVGVGRLMTDLERFYIDSPVYDLDWFWQDVRDY